MYTKAQAIAIITNFRKFVSDIENKVDGEFWSSFKNECAVRACEYNPGSIGMAYALYDLWFGSSTPNSILIHIIKNKSPEDIVNGEYSKILLNMLYVYFLSRGKPELSNVENIANIIGVKFDLGI